MVDCKAIEQAATIVKLVYSIVIIGESEAFELEKLAVGALLVSIIVLSGLGLVMVTQHDCFSFYSNQLLMHVWLCSLISFDPPFQTNPASLEPRADQLVHVSFFPPLPFWISNFEFH